MVLVEIGYYGGESMLTAVLQDGTRISMADKWFESELMDLRKKQQFKCPVCSAAVTLKLGSKRQWHFAHHTKHTCRISLEPESPYHLKGKLDIYHWLINQGIKASLEMYLPLIQQRPDVLCKVEGKLYAIEYQCSPLSEELFFERTMGYRRMGITPIWILGGNRLRRKQAEQYHLLGFEWNTSRLNRLEQMYVTYYCSETQLWAFLFELQSYSTNGALARLSYKRQNTLSIEDLLYPRDIAPYQYKSWLNIKKAGDIRASNPTLPKVKSDFRNGYIKKRFH
ncbi:competence protein CoiA [Alkalicoccobacillus plakortidis]|uniref:Competence protein CoiA n=1 Tax=Alkalicoccobacillus plakortidis TaxID=444060 RepID=A0ABT0XGN8_9BACI|nr:competence protein CoiA family protein [Alkalicoccobacillus plakortidis]MCM2675056.1 hypothetical protein [Alkalicoccobacillus plakortidis]